MFSYPDKISSAPVCNIVNDCSIMTFSAKIDNWTFSQSTKNLTSVLGPSSAFYRQKW